MTNYSYFESKEEQPEKDFRVNISVEPYGDNEELRETTNTFDFKTAQEMAEELMAIRDWRKQPKEKKEEKRSCEPTKCIECEHYYANKKCLIELFDKGKSESVCLANNYIWLKPKQLPKVYLLNFDEIRAALSDCLPDHGYRAFSDLVSFVEKIYEKVEG